MNTEAGTNSHGKVAKLLHWLLALNIGATLVFSAGMADLSDARKEIEYGDHAFSVTTILVLMLIRTVWRMINPPHGLPESMSSGSKAMAQAMHIALYVLIFAQIGVGILLASTTAVIFRAEPYGIDYTSWSLVEPANHGWLLTLHEAGAITIASFVVLHILAALKHHFLDKDNVLRRMLPFVKIG